MPGFNSDTTQFSAENAVVLAQLCNAAYLDEASAREATLKLDLRGFIWIDLTEHFDDTYAIVASGPGFVVIAFRGTKSFANWMTDLQATPVSYPWVFESAPEVGAIHAGFGHVLRDAWTQIADALIDIVPPPDTVLGNPEPPALWLTGHSLGGALAVLTGAAFSMWMNAPIRSVNGIYTFGQPRVGLYSFCGNYDHLLKNRTFRFVNKHDLVPRVPFRGWDYADVGNLIHFDDSGTARRESPQWTSFLNRTFQSFEEFFDIAGHSQEDVHDHDMGGYERLVESQSANLNALFA